MWLRFISNLRRERTCILTSKWKRRMTRRDMERTSRNCWSGISKNKIIEGFSGFSLLGRILFDVKISIMVIPFLFLFPSGILLNVLTLYYHILYQSSQPILSFRSFENMIYNQNKIKKHNRRLMYFNNNFITILKLLDIIDQPIYI